MDSRTIINPLFTGRCSRIYKVHLIPRDKNGWAPLQLCALSLYYDSNRGLILHSAIVMDGLPIVVMVLHSWWCFVVGEAGKIIRWAGNTRCDLTQIGWLVITLNLMKV